MIHREPPLPTSAIGFSQDFYRYLGDGITPTDHSLAVDAALASGYEGETVRFVRTQTLSADEVETAWAQEAFRDHYLQLGTRGVHVSVVADKLILQDADYYSLALAQVATEHAGWIDAGKNGREIKVIGNEAYIGATGLHAELDATLAGAAIDLSRRIKAAYPGVKTAMPALGTFQGGSLAAAKAELDDNWALYLSLFAGHRTFDYACANLYRLTGASTNELIVYGADSLRANAASLGVLPMVTEIGVLNPSAADIASVLGAVGSDMPRIVWRVGAGDAYDMIASGAIEVPATI